jgi:cell division inhibitor SulA
LTTHSPLSTTSRTLAAIVRAEVVGRPETLGHTHEAGRSRISALRRNLGAPRRAQLCARIPVYLYSPGVSSDLRCHAFCAATHSSDERTRSIDALLDESMYPGSGGISLWKGNQLARSVGRTVPTGYDRLTRELPGGGWPVGALVELMIQQPGIGELRLLQPALTSVAKRPVVLVKPPQVPNALGLSSIGMLADKLMRLEPANTADTLWSTEQILKANTCGAVILWQQHIRAESLRRLSLHAQSSEGSSVSPYRARCRVPTARTARRRSAISRPLTISTRCARI